VEAAWRVVDPVLQDPSPVAHYDPGTWGPRQADAVIDDGGSWHNPKAESSPPC
jgi:glucose-6-phosphate 1-dehydrogenase